MLNKLRLFLFPSKENRSMYEIVGDEVGTYNLVQRFYNIMENDPKAIECLKTHELIDGKVPEEVKNKLFMFLSGWFGGPNLFVRNHGAPRMAARHGHIKISSRERDQWLYCINKSLDQNHINISRKNKKIMKNSFMALALRIENHS